MTKWHPKRRIMPAMLLPTNKSYTEVIMICLQTYHICSTVTAVDNFGQRTIWQYDIDSIMFILERKYHEKRTTSLLYYTAIRWCWFLKKNCWRCLWPTLWVVYDPSIVVHWELSYFTLLPIKREIIVKPARYATTWHRIFVSLKMKSVWDMRWGPLYGSHN